jgi:hypothetical protein
MSNASVLSLRLIGLLLLSGCSTTLKGPRSMTHDQTTSSEILFEDSMQANWEESWFLDGKRAKLEHKNGGLEFIATPSNVDKNVDRETFDAHHAVLWTKQEFEGDIRISYTYTTLPDSTWTNLIYIQARGIGEGPYTEDITEWNEDREVAVMSDYFNYMDLMSISLRNGIRLRRYPTVNYETGERYPESGLIAPMVEHEGLPKGRELYFEVEKRRESLQLLIQDVETGKAIVDYTWSLEDVPGDRDPKYIENGRIGIRLMGGHMLHFKNFNVERLQAF